MVEAAAPLVSLLTPSTPSPNILWSVPWLAWLTAYTATYLLCLYLINKVKPFCILMLDL